MKWQGLINYYDAATGFSLLPNKEYKNFRQRLRLAKQASKRFSPKKEKSRMFVDWSK